ncbi:Glycosyltransferase, catalytic subunit of cellulose synthase and poly-beta-1,6-N-acetylglucosamine synthase [Paracoccus alcaliphilus]|uniref:Glycosyltransferase, catalytic subunit of cellulose synthase and poly-beta-1,6-N-acetylglucosamine synthase n=1 Tax=Paracoccus alcaliphilus TaxID=34002 RepID=A0A1H8I411_9RHOB|nr:glycosyltransferase [Paracoccus alcaliphilus]WCR19514.1 glycosyltransferase [Paracoccus alcaliphilus]SEN63072.1 Glycosyltransferase, catalytic subunit of cellulose synthase and poly-beta-1,6-N-acetylglucosamine synthase [Paracoccus alcaliphilus]
MAQTAYRNQDSAPAAEQIDARAAPSRLIGPALAPRNQRPLGQILLEDGAVDPANLLKASVMRQRQNVRLGQILLTHGWVTPAALSRALSRQWRTTAVDPAETPGDPRLIDAAGADFCLAEAILPWRRIGGVTWIATARPERFAALLPRLPAEFGTIRMLLCSEEQAQQAVLASRRTALIRRAENRVSPVESCRTRNEARSGRLAALLIALTVLGLWLAPIAVLSALTAWAVLALLCQSALKLLAAIATRRARAEDARSRQAIAEGRLHAPEMTAPLPLISVMVPLFRESDVAGKLVARLARLTYPRELTDILLVVEVSDEVTREALRDARLPHWLRVIEVPDGPIQTKPRALNYALNFCRGEIVGIWDAEDRPDPDQLHKVARRFHFAPDDVACLQGALDYYNPRSNWLARCFTIEYATWFRVLLPGVARMGLVVPLGGTTLFFRRAALEAVDAWDAWNVTEDADLGVRLARRGWRTEILDTTTDEEANCRVLPWIKQRSRWLKGYAMTWGVHMRNPVALWRDLGPLRFLAFQVQFFGSLSQYLLAPLLWSFWLLAFALPHPLSATAAALPGAQAGLTLFALFVSAEILGIIVGMWAVSGAKHRHLLAWVPTMHLYFPLGCVAGWKAIYEVVFKPFYWDKTAHGLFDVAEETASPAPDMVSLPVLGQIGGISLTERTEDIADGASPADADNPAKPRLRLAEVTLPQPRAARA